MGTFIQKKCGGVTATIAPICALNVSRTTPVTLDANTSILIQDWKNNE